MTFLTGDFLTVPVRGLPVWFWLMILAYLVFIPCGWLVYRRRLRRLDIKLGSFLNDYLAWRFAAGLPQKAAAALAQKTAKTRFRTLKFKEQEGSRGTRSGVRVSVGFGLSVRDGVFIPGQGPLVYPVTGGARAAATQMHAFTPAIRPLVTGQLWPQGDRLLAPLEHERQSRESQKKELAAVFGGLFDSSKVSVAVQHRSTLIFESYASGFGPATPQLFKAVTPFVFATVFGLLSHQRRLAVEQAIPEGNRNADSRNQIRFIDLLKSVSGLSPVSEKALMRGLFQPDPGVFAGTKQRKKGAAGIREMIAELKQTKPNGQVWDPGAASVLTLSQLLSLGFGGRPDIYRTFVRRSLFDRLAMVNSTMAVTVDGLIQSWSGLISTPRDLLRFAALYQNGGFWQGERLLEESWLEHAGTPVEASGNAAAGIQSVLNVKAKEPGSGKSKFKARNYKTGKTGVKHGKARRGKTRHGGLPYPGLPADAIFALRDGHSVLAIMPGQKVSVILASPERVLPDHAIESFIRRVLKLTQSPDGAGLRADPSLMPLQSREETRAEIQEQTGPDTQEQTEKQIGEETGAETQEAPQTETGQKPAPLFGYNQCVSKDLTQNPSRQGV